MATGSCSDLVFPYRHLPHIPMLALTHPRPFLPSKERPPWLSSLIRLHSKASTRRILIVRTNFIFFSERTPTTNEKSSPTTFTFDILDGHMFHPLAAIRVHASICLCPYLRSFKIPSLHRRPRIPFLPLPCLLCCNSVAILGGQSQSR